MNNKGDGKTLTDLLKIGATGAAFVTALTLAPYASAEKPHTDQSKQKDKETKQRRNQQANNRSPYTRHASGLEAGISSGLSGESRKGKKGKKVKRDKKPNERPVVPPKANPLGKMHAGEKQIQLELEYDGVEGQGSTPESHTISGGIRKVGGDTTFSAIGKYVWTENVVDDLAQLDVEGKHTFHFGKNKNHHLDAVIRVIIGTHSKGAGFAVGYRSNNIGAGVNYAFRKDKFTYEDAAGTTITSSDSQSHMFGGDVSGSFGNKIKGYARLGYAGMFNETTGYTMPVGGSKTNTSTDQWSHSIYATVGCKNTNPNALFQDAYMTMLWNRTITRNLLASPITETELDKWTLDAQAHLKLGKGKILGSGDGMHLIFGGGIGQAEDSLGVMQMQGNVRAQIGFGEYADENARANQNVARVVDSNSADAERVLREQRLANDWRAVSYKTFGAEYSNDRLANTQEFAVNGTWNQPIKGFGRRVGLGLEYRHTFDSIDRKAITGSITWENDSGTQVTARGGYGFGTNGQGAMWGASVKHRLDASGVLSK